MFQRSSVFTVVALFLIFLFAGPSHGQTTSGDLVGTVKDATGSLVPNATITVTAESTGVSKTITGSSNGEFRVGNLLADKYDVVVEAAGFQKYDLKGVLIELNKTSTISIPLSLGTSQSVEVSADSGAVLDTTSTNLSQTFDNQTLSDLPTASVGVGVLNVSLLSPGVASSGGLGIGVGPSIGGQRPRNNNFEIEGIDNNNKAVTGPLVYVPNDAVGSFTLITNQFSPEFGHSSGGQFNTTVVSGTNKFHGRAYEYFQNRDLNAAEGIAGGKIPIPRFDFNRYGGQLGGPIFKDKLFFFGNYERQTTGQSASYYLCTPTAAGLTALQAPDSGFSAVNLAQYLKYTPVANYLGGAQVTDANDNGCFSGAPGPQVLTVTNAAGAPTNIPLGNYLVSAPNFINFDALTTSIDYTITSKDSLRGRYIYNTQGSEDTAANLPVFFTTQPFRFHLFALSEFHSFTSNLTNEFRIGYNRYSNTLGAGNFSYPGLDVFPNLQFYDQGFISYGPDGNAPQFTIQNLYQITDNVSYVKGKHTLKFGFDGRKYISPQGFTQRARGDYEWAELDQFLHDLAPDSNGFAERSTGDNTYYGDQTALYGYANDTYRVTPTVTINAGLRYEFTAVPVGERTQRFNAISSVPGLINFHAPQPTYTSFAPRVGINWAPDSKTSVRAGFGVAQDVLFDNLGTLSFPPQLSQTNDVGTAKYPFSAPGFLAGGGLPPGANGAQVLSQADARAETSAYLPDQITPYAETYTLTIQRTVGTGLTAEIGYVGTRGIHLPTQIQYDITPRTNKLNNLPTYLADGTTVLEKAGPNATNLGDIQALSNILPAFAAAGFQSKITSYQPYSSSNYNGLVANLQGRLHNGLQLNFSYTFSKDMDNATDEVFATVLTPRRPQNSQDLSGDYSRSALDRTHRVTLEAVYDLPFYKHSGFLLRNVVGNWTVSPIYTYESPEYATVLSGDNALQNGDSGAAIDRPLINPNGVKGTGTGVTAIMDDAGNTIGYQANSNAYYVQAGPGTIPTAGRNTLPIRPINNFDLSAFKRITVRDHYSFEFGAQGFNVLNHAQYLPGSVDNVNGPSYTASYDFQTVSSGAFNHPEKIFGNNPRTMQLSARIIF